MLLVNTSLGNAFMKVMEPKKDTVKAIYWLNRAMENGDTDANELLEKFINNLQSIPQKAMKFETK
ncbi:10383_t:CDS:2 [Diversispora eburnea]|uniref:10383_t:CDS:1 n=1 Tax=Diversispora eburnea TaxID=1213867 RepID=A0A9N9G4R2_9GLOM|nr:10383_t:CDS:2 [Diversispora eburnea]